MVDLRTAPYAALVLRVGLGAMFIAHSLRLGVPAVPDAGDRRAGALLGDSADALRRGRSAGTTALARA